ncbi:MAG: GNAT family N-acetyltransferase [Dehalococcoidaceae bacterium]|nr:GNAT family N-acetyltransferase [Dehalococcoidaceae bacterium]
MNTPLDGLRRLGIKDRDTATAVAAKAFKDYTMLEYFYPDETRRHAVAETFILITMAVCLKYGEVYTTPGALQGICAWLGPGKAPFGGWQMLRSVPLPVMLRFGRQGGSQMRAYGEYSDRLHRELAPEPHWFLQLLGVDPAYHGQGVSSRLVKPMLERIDREGLPCFVDTNTEKNVAIYRHFGFELISESKVPGTELPHYALLRKPRGC